MRDALNLNILPRIPEDMSSSFNPGVRSFISSDGYYGYQPPAQNKRDGESNLSAEEVNVPMCVDFQFNNNHPEKQTMEFYDYSVPRYVNRKRSWDFSYESPVFKKRRQDESNIKIRKKIVQNSTGAKESTLLEDLLLETHGSCLYNWNTSDL